MSMFTTLITLTTVIIVSVQVTSPMVITSTLASTITTTLATNISQNNIANNPLGLSNHQQRSVFAPTSTKILDLDAGHQVSVDVTKNDNVSSQSYLFFSTADTINYWPTSCRAHIVSPLLKLNRTDHREHGISGFTIWRRPSLHSTTTELVWFDVHYDRLYHTTVKHNKTAACDQSQMSLVQSNSSIRFIENPFHVMFNDSTSDDSNTTSKADANNNSAPIVEKLVKVAIDNNKQMLFLSNLLNNRIDIYRLLVDTNDTTLSDNVLATWIASIDTERPFDITLDEDEHRLFWIANRYQICSLSYEIHQFAQWSNQSNCLSIDQPAAALTIDRKAKQLYWIEREPEGHIQRIANYDLLRQGGDNVSEKIYKINEPSSIRAIDLDSKAGMFYVGDQFDVIAINPKKTSIEPELVQVELSTLFDLKLVSVNMFDKTGNEGDHQTEVSIQTTTMITPTITVLSSPSDSNVVILKRNMFVNFLIFVCSLVILIAIFLAALKLWRIHRRQDEEGDWRRLSGQEIESNRNMFARLLSCCMPRWETTQEDKYDQLSAASLPSLLAETQNTFGGQADAQCQQQFRANIRVAGQAPGLSDDIEDLLTSPPATAGSPSQISFVNPAAFVNNPRRGCLACREPDICQEKGICMVTYRLQQRAC